jgi:hypothetical protein
MEQCPAPEEEGEVLVIEIDGKAIPTATAEELAKRRGPRQRHAKGCACGCQRHRGQRKRRGKKRKRRRKGDKSKNGRSATLVVMYTLKRGPDGLLHGPLNKKVWALHGPRRRAFEWARAQATKRGFPPDTKKMVQIVVDGESVWSSGCASCFRTRSSRWTCGTRRNGSGKRGGSFMPRGARSWPGGWSR